jgi:hypothetical protein
MILMFRRPELISFLLLAAASSALTSCGARPNNARVEYEMGDRITVGPLTYNVVETAWRSQLGSDFKLRTPQDRFLLVTISVTNGGGKEASVPLLSLENENGKIYQESDNGEGVDNWFGLLRSLTPAQTQQGRLLFDVPLTGYRLRVTDGGEPGNEKSTFIRIPLRMDGDSGLDSAPTVRAPVK